MTLVRPSPHIRAALHSSAIAGVVSLAVVFGAVLCYPSATSVLLQRLRSPIRNASLETEHQQRRRTRLLAAPAKR